MTRPDIARVAAALAGARSALFITGAGISADSGLPTYRGIGGLYARERTEEGYAIEDALSGAMLRARPELCWKYIRQIEEACRGARPNRGHEVIAAFERRLERCWVLTQNVDGLHAAAGSRNVVAIHGDVHRLLCLGCGERRRVEDYAEMPALPTCAGCGALVRPEVVLFGEMLPEPEVLVLRRELIRGFDVVLSIGTSSLFPYIAEPMWLARRTGALTVEINPDRTEVSDLASVRLEGRAAEELAAIWKATEERSPEGSSPRAGRLE